MRRAAEWPKVLVPYDSMEPEKRRNAIDLRRPSSQHSQVERDRERVRRLHGVACTLSVVGRLSVLGTLRSYELRYVAETSAGMQQRAEFDANAKRRHTPSKIVRLRLVALRSAAFSARTAAIDK